MLHWNVLISDVSPATSNAPFKFNLPLQEACDRTVHTLCSKHTKPSFPCCWDKKRKIGLMSFDHQWLDRVFASRCSEMNDWKMFDSFEQDKFVLKMVLFLWLRWWLLSAMQIYNSGAELKAIHVGLDQSEHWNQPPHVHLFLIHVHPLDFDFWCFTFFSPGEKNRAHSQVQKCFLPQNSFAKEFFQRCAH